MVLRIAGIAVGAGTAAAVAGGLVGGLVPSSPITTLQDAVQCSPNVTFGCSSVDINFLPGSRIFPTSDWEQLFVDIYNEVSPQCNEKYERILQNATLMSEETVDGVLYTSWTGCVSCYPNCPSPNAMFGSNVLLDATGIGADSNSTNTTSSAEESGKNTTRYLEETFENEFNEAISVQFREMLEALDSYYKQKAIEEAGGDINNITVQMGVISGSSGARGEEGDYELEELIDWSTAPTASMYPSEMPSDTPSVSKVPSSTPSEMPSLSMAPSTIPSETPTDRKSVV